MNAKRRRDIGKLIAQLEDIHTALEEIQIEEQDCFDNLPEGLQDAEQGQTIQEHADNLEDRRSELEDLISELTEIIEQ